MGDMAEMYDEMYWELEDDDQWSPPRSPMSERFERITKEMTEQRYCADHQGKASHYAKENCYVCKLREARAEEHRDHAREINALKRKVAMYQEGLQKAKELFRALAESMED